MNEVIGSTWLASILTQMTAAGGVLDGVKVHLFKNDIQLTPGVLVSQLIEADYTGYAASAELAWGAPFLTVTGDGKVVADNVQFQPTGTATACDVYGYWVMPTVATTTPIQVVKFSSPVPMTGPLSAIIVTPEFTMPQK